MTDMHISFIFFCALICNFSIAAIYNDNRDDKRQKVATFHFAEYAYKETSKNEIIFHDFEEACKQLATCAAIKNSVAKKSCVRLCISHSCYQDIYAFDELEDGEIDVRLNSFKGCVIQRIGNTNAKRL